METILETSNEPPKPKELLSERVYIKKSHKPGDQITVYVNGYGQQFNIVSVGDIQRDINGAEFYELSLVSAY